VIVVRFLAFYPQPADLVAFEQHYFDVHVPLAKKLPGLRRYTVSRGAMTIRGAETCHLIAELDWDDMDSLRRDFSSELGKAAARDVDELAKLCPGIQTVVFELDEP
jgi:uncharacterized protein (TIGR02118 family)